MSLSFGRPASKRGVGSKSFHPNCDPLEVRELLSVGVHGHLLEHNPIGAGGPLHGAAALSNTAHAASRGTTTAFYAVGLAWNASLPGQSGELRLTVYLAILKNGRGTGTLSDPVNSHVNSHMDVLQTVKHGSRYQISGAISESNDPSLLGQPIEIVAVAHGEATRLELLLGGETFPGLGRIIRITNVRSNTTSGLPVT